MHELSIAMSLVDLAQEEAARGGAGVQSVHIRVGRLAGVVKDALISSYEMAGFETSLQGSQLVIEDARGSCATNPGASRSTLMFFTPTRSSPTRER